MKVIAIVGEKVRNFNNMEEAVKWSCGERKKAIEPQPIEDLDAVLIKQAIKTIQSLMNEVLELRQENISLKKQLKPF